MQDHAHRVVSGLGATGLHATSRRTVRRADYLARYGFIYESNQPPALELDLPIGWAVEEKYVAKYDNPPVDTPTRMVGLTCTACHSNRIDVKGADGRVRGVLIEGGSAMIDLGSFEQAVGKALGYTWLFPMRFARFARNVLGADLPDRDPRKQKLADDLKAAAEVVTERAMEELKYGRLTGGFSRTDAPRESAIAFSAKSATPI